MPELQESIFNFTAEPKDRDIPEEAAKALKLWFEAPHTMTIGDACNLHEWFGLDMDSIRWGVK